MEEQLCESTDKNSRFKDILYFTLSVIGLFSVLFFALGFMFTFGYYSGAGALWSGNQNEEITVTAGFFILFNLLPEFLNSIFAAILTWQMGLLVVFVIFLALILKRYASQSTNNKFYAIVESSHLNYLLVILTLIWVVIASMGQGKLTATNNIEKLLKSGCVGRADGWNQCHQIWHKDKLIHEGYLVSKTSASVIMFKRDLQALEYITMPEGAILRRQFVPPEEVSGSASP